MHKSYKDCTRGRRKFPIQTPTSSFSTAVLSRMLLVAFTINRGLLHQPHLPDLALLSLAEWTGELRASRARGRARLRIADLQQPTSGGMNFCD